MDLASEARANSVVEEQQNGTPSLSRPLPHVVWRRVAYYLSDSLPTLLVLSNLNSEFQDICRPYTSSLFQTIEYSKAPAPRDYYYHYLVHLILEGHLDPTSILEFYYSEGGKVIPPFIPSSTARPGLPNDTTEQQVRRFDRLVREAIRASPWIPADLENEVCDRFREADADAALVILLPLCTRLKLLEIPEGLQMCAAMVQSITWEYQRRGITGEQARQKAIEAARRDRRGRPWRDRWAMDSSETLPFPELLMLFVRSSQFGYSFPLIEMTPYMGFPSLHRMILSGVRDLSFPSWPSGDVKSSCPEIYFKESSVSKEAVLAFAQGIEGPCEIRQWYERPREDISRSWEGDPAWDRVLIERRADGTKSIETRLDFDGGNPGYDHAWVSWLCNGKMQDWKRIDEEFRPQDNDQDNEWLQGMFK